MQAIVKERLPKFSEEEVGLVKGSIDFLGINHYTSFYMFNPDSPHPPAPGYQNDWHAGFACNILSLSLSQKLRLLKHKKHHFEAFSSSFGSS